MDSFKLLYFVIFVLNLYKINAQISDKRLCVDEECKAPISLAKTLLKYSSPDSRILSFAPNVDVTIYSKSAGSQVNLWGAEINGKRGYIPKHMVRETKILQKPELLVDTEFTNDTETKQVPYEVEPDKVQEPYEVVDGTTIYLSPQGDIIPSTTESSLHPTALPDPRNTENNIAPVASEVLKTPSSKEVRSSTTPVVASEQNVVIGTAPSDDIAREEIKGGHPSVLKNEQTVANKENVGKQQEHSAPAIKEEIVEEAAHNDITKELPLKKERQDEVAESEEAKSHSEDEDNLQDDPLNDGVDLEFDESGEAREEIEEDDSNLLQENEAHQNVVLTEQETGSTNLEATTANESVEIQQVLELFISSDVTQDVLLNVNVNSDNILEKVTDVDNENLVKSQNEAVNQDEENNKVTLDVVPFPSHVSNSEEFTDSTQQLESSESKHVTAVENDEEVVQESVKSEFQGNKANKQNIEASTLLPEWEVPQPFDNTFEEVTPNPLQPATTDEVRVEENTRSTLPPLGLFGENLNNHIEVQNVVNDSENLNNEGESQNVVDGPPEPVFLDQSNAEKTDNIERTEETTNDVSDNSHIHEISEEDNDNSTGFFSGLMAMFGSGEKLSEDVSSETEDDSSETEDDSSATEDFIPAPVSAFGGADIESENYIDEGVKEQFGDATSCQNSEALVTNVEGEFFNFNSDVFVYLVTTAISVVVFLFGYIFLDKTKRQGPLIAKINNLEKELLVMVKENQILQEKSLAASDYETNDRFFSETVEELKRELHEITKKKVVLEDQVQSLEKELENSTEVGMELNRMLSEILNSEGGSDILRTNIEQLQRQLVELQATVNSTNQSLTIVNTENHKLKLELELSNKKVLHLQSELDKLLLNVLKIEEEKETQQSNLEKLITNHRQNYEEVSAKLRMKEEEYNMELRQLRNLVEETARKLELKTREHTVLTDILKHVKSVENNDGSTLQSLLEVSGMRAELQLLKSENQKFREKLHQEQEMKSAYEKKAQVATEEVQQLKDKYDAADKIRVEAQTKLEVLSNYFKDREAQLQKDIGKHESLWAEKQGEATSTTERIKFMQEQLQNYKAQTESLKQEIMSQEVELKSQISVLEKKAHENWVSARQAERKVEEAKQEAAQLRHRLTLRERAIQEDKNQQRFLSPVEQNGDMSVSPLEASASPPLLYGTRDHMTKSPPIPGLPPFLPPPPGVPFMPPPLQGVPPFMPPLPNMFPGDHRPPPLGRMSSPPLNSRYSPNSRGYSPYDRNSSSPSDSEYGTSPPHHRGYIPYSNRMESRRDYKRPPPVRSNGRNIVKGGGSSGSGNSNESLEKINREQSKV